MKNKLEIEHVEKSFFGKKALDNVSFQVNGGEIFGILGPNGAGKTTLIRIINRIIEADKGGVKLNGNLLSDKDLKKIGYLPEERGLYKSMTVYDHLIFLGRLRGLSKLEAKQKTNKWLQHFSIESWKTKRIEELSKGMAQKVQFIGTVLHEPELLILDEPLSGFDPINVALIMEELKRFKEEGKIIILSTHNMRSVEDICDKAILIHQAKKIAEGSISELRTVNYNDVYEIIFKGNMIAFANSLWAGFELLDKTILEDNNKFRVTVKLLGNNNFHDLLKVLMESIEIESAKKYLPSMQDVFIELTQEKTEKNA